MQRKRETLVVVRGGGDIATGTIQKLWNSGFGLVILETDRPTAIRRKVALSQAVYEGTATVEDLTAARIESTDEIEKEWEKGRIPLLVDPECRCLEDLKPLALVDAILAKKNLGTHRKMAKYTLALGPGFTAGADVDLVIETMARPFTGPGSSGRALRCRIQAFPASSPVTERSGWFMPRRMGRFISSMTSGILWKKENPWV